MNRVILLLAVACLASPLAADEGDPVAIIRNSDGDFMIQTMWGVQLSIHNGGDVCKYGSVGASDLKLGKLFGDEAFAILDRKPNEPNLTWTTDFTAQAAAIENASSNAIQIARFGGMTSIVVDGVTITYLPEPNVVLKGDRKHAKRHEQFLKCDLLISSANAAELATKHDVKVLLLDGQQPDDKVETLPSNTLTISSAYDSSKLRQVSLSTMPPELPKEYRDLVERKEKACDASQRVFAELSVAQLNFRPSNGTHTPRWNVEHMMGRELHFFSQIFHELDPAIPVMNLNPKQMPPDYKARHGDWTGEEEARQMQRVSSFTRRYAYLLRDLDMDKKAPGSFWTPRKLLLQMERHYSEHTANVQKKFKLPDWPAK